MKKIILKNEFQEKVMKKILKYEEEMMVMSEKRGNKLTNVIQIVREFRHQIE